VLDWASHLETLVEQPFIAEWFTSLSGFARVLWIGTRGVGMSGLILAEPGEVLVTRTVRDLVAGSGIAFEERG